MIIKVKETHITEREIEISFPLFTYDETKNKYYYNYGEKKCIVINLDYKSIQNWLYLNEGLEYRQISKELFFAAFDENLKNILTILNQ
jgi:hypothetical protein